MRYKKILFPLFVFIAVLFLYIWQRMNFSTPRIVMIGSGYGTELNDGRVLTALHVAMRLDFPIVYADSYKDIAIIETGHKNKYKLGLVSSARDFLFTEAIPQPGESGKPHLIGGKIYGVIIGENGGHGVAAAFDESIIRLLNKKQLREGG